MFCRIFRWFIACSVDEGRSPGCLTSSHIKRCRRCNRYYKDQTMVDRSLASGKVQYSRVAPDSYATIMEELPQRDAAVTHRRPTLTKQKKWAFAAVLVFFGFSLVGLLITDKFSSKPPPPAPAEQQVLSLPFIPSGNAVKMTLDQYSLEKEIQNLSSDISEIAKFFSQQAASIHLLSRLTDED